MSKHLPCDRLDSIKWVMEHPYRIRDHRLAQMARRFARRQY
jgi:hypothetical protein